MRLMSVLVHSVYYKVFGLSLTFAFLATYTLSGAALHEMHLARNVCDTTLTALANPCSDDFRVRDMYAFLDQSFNDFYLCFIQIEDEPMRFCLLSYYLSLKTDVPEHLFTPFLKMTMWTLMAHPNVGRYDLWRQVLFFLETILKKIIFVAKVLEEITDNQFLHQNVLTLLNTRLKYEFETRFLKQLKTEEDNVENDLKAESDFWENATKVTIRWKLIKKNVLPPKLIAAISLFYILGLYAVSYTHLTLPTILLV